MKFRILKLINLAKINISYYLKYKSEFICKGASY